MTIEDELRSLMVKKSGSVNKFASECGVPYSTIASIFRRGVINTNINTIIKICQALQISADELSNGRITYLAEVAHPLIEFEKLSKDNQTRLLAYYQTLLDSQEDKA